MYILYFLYYTMCFVVHTILGLSVYIVSQVRQRKQLKTMACGDFVRSPTMTIYIHIRYGTTRGRFSVNVISIYTLGVLCTHSTRGNSEHVHLYRRRSRREREREWENIQKKTLLIGLCHHAHFYTAFSSGTIHEHAYTYDACPKIKKILRLPVHQRVYNTHNTNAYGTQQTLVGRSRHFTDRITLSIHFPPFNPFHNSTEISLGQPIRTIIKSRYSLQESDTFSASTYT